MDNKNLPSSFFAPRLTRFQTAIRSMIICLVILTIAPACSSTDAQTPPQQILPTCSLGSTTCEDSVPVITDYKSCVAAGHKILKTMPPRCLDGAGKVYTSTAFGKPAGEVAPIKKLCKDLCGDGSCQEMVCMAVGCPCAENSTSCPADCK